jgi:TRAP-type mannitol/chloroaromatic compound transport system permease small subunit
VLPFVVVMLWRLWQRFVSLYHMGILSWLSCGGVTDFVMTFLVVIVCRRKVFGAYTRAFVHVIKSYSSLLPRLKSERI